MHQKEEFAEVKEAMRRVRDIKTGRNYHHAGSCVDRRKPETFALSKKLLENKRSNHFALNEHVSNLASLQRRLSSMGNVS